jgi:NADH dehydrogenase
MAGRVFVSGGSGFVGSAVIEELGLRGVGANAVVHRKTLEIGGDVQSFPGGLFDAAALDAAMKGCEQVIHLVGIIMEDRGRGVTFEKMHVEGTRAVVDAAKRNGIRRLVHMSALGARAGAASEYHRTKWAAEEYVAGSGLEWTIFRPSLIHGPRGEFMAMEVKWARKRAAPFLFMPYFGRGILGLGGGALVQPIYVRDVARAFADALGNLSAIGKRYEIGGAERMDWPGMHRIIARAVVGKERMTMAIPAWYGKLLAAVVPGNWLGFNRDQVVMSQEDNVAEVESFVRDFGWTPRGLGETLAEYAKQL